jgi:Ser/Thr protein kinase RdoA (MazF antagonist)
MSPGLTQWLNNWSLDVQTVVRVGGGERKDVWHVDGAGGAFVLRIYPPDEIPVAVTTECRWLTALNTQLPEVPRPVPTNGMELVAAQHGQTAVLTSWTAGEHAHPDNPTHQQLAADFLARLHTAGEVFVSEGTRPGYPALRDLDWTSNPWWNTRDVEATCERFAEQDLWQRLSGRMQEASATLASLAKLDLRDTLIHGDFYARNLIVENDELQAVVDWDECAIDWRALEVANAAWSFSGHRNGQHVLDVSEMQQFVDRYHNVGIALTADEQSVLLPLLGLRFLWETCYDFARVARGDEWEPPAETVAYHHGQLDMLDAHEP